MELNNIFKITQKNIQIICCSNNWVIINGHYNEPFLITKQLSDIGLLYTSTFTISTSTLEVYTLSETFMTKPTYKHLEYIASKLPHNLYTELGNVPLDTKRAKICIADFIKSLIDTIDRYH